MCIIQNGVLFISLQFSNSLGNTEQQSGRYLSSTASVTHLSFIVPFTYLNAQVLQAVQPIHQLINPFEHVSVLVPQIL